MDEDVTITIHWYCLCFVGVAKWQTLDDYEPDECDTEFDTEDLLQNWQDGCCAAMCPRCRAELTQKYDKPELLPIQ